MEPIIESGHGLPMPRAAHNPARAARASARFRLRISGQPPGSSDATQRNASGTLRNAVGSFVPGFHVAGFWAGVFGAIVYSIVSWLLSALIPKRT